MDSLSKPTICRFGSFASLRPRLDKARSSPESRRGHKGWVRQHMGQQPTDSLKLRAGLSTRSRHCTISAAKSSADMPYVSGSIAL